MPKIFISYRRDDTLAFTGRLHDKLTDRFGRDQVFMDFDNIPLGSDFREHLHVSLEKCDVLLAVIGPNWTGKVADANKNRLSDPADFVRLEIQVALERNIPIIPVLVGDATMPSEEDLPPDLKPLLYRQAAAVDMARDFHVHAQRLIDGIKRLKSDRDSESSPDRTDTEHSEVERVVTPTWIAWILSLFGGALYADEKSPPKTIASWSTLGLFFSATWLLLLFLLPLKTSSGLVGFSLFLCLPLYFYIFLYVIFKYSSHPPILNLNKYHNVKFVASYLIISVLILSISDTLASTFNGWLGVNIIGLLLGCMVAIPHLWLCNLKDKKMTYIVLVVVAGWSAVVVGFGVAELFFDVSFFLKDEFLVIPPLFYASEFAAISAAPYITRDVRRGMHSSKN